MKKTSTFSKIGFGSASFIKQMAFYTRYHRSIANKITHFIGVPMIVFSLMIPLQWFEVGIHLTGSLNLVWLSLLALFIYYVWLEWRLALLTIFVLVVLAMVARSCFFLFPTWQGFAWFAGLFVGGWVIQLIGHLFEGKRPALVDNVTQIFIAPIFLVAEVCFMAGLFEKLEESVQEAAA